MMKMVATSNSSNQLFITSADETFDAGHPAANFDNTYFTLQGGLKVGYQLKPWINIFVNGTGYFIPEMAIKVIHADGIGPQPRQERRAAWIAARAGGLFSKYLPYTSFMAVKSFMSFR